MTENKGDLISREDLKEALSDKDLITWTHEYGDAIPLDWLMSAIDNASTVEPCYQTTSCLDCKMYDKEKHNCPRFCEVIRSAIEERPKGEFALKELEGWLTSCGYASGTVEDRLEEFKRFVEKKRKEAEE